jgi:hypothetical protein
VFNSTHQLVNFEKKSLASPDELTAKILRTNTRMFFYTDETVARAWSSNSSCSICCGFAVQQVVQQIHNKSTTYRLVDKSKTNPQHLDMSRCCGFAVHSTTNPQQIETIEYGFRLVRNKSRSCTTNPQQIHNKSNMWSLSLKCATAATSTDARDDGSNTPRSPVGALFSASGRRSRLIVVATGAPSIKRVALGPDTQQPVM